MINLKVKKSKEKLFPLNNKLRPGWYRVVETEYECHEGAIVLVMSGETDKIVFLGFVKGESHPEIWNTAPSYFVEKLDDVNITLEF